MHTGHYFSIWSLILSTTPLPLSISPWCCSERSHITCLLTTGRMSSGKTYVKFTQSLVKRPFGGLGDGHSKEKMVEQPYLGHLYHWEGSLRVLCLAIVSGLGLSSLSRPLLPASPQTPPLSLFPVIHGQIRHCLLMILVPWLSSWTPFLLVYFFLNLEI